MKNAAFTAAAIPEPFKILGQRMQPFSVGHEILLQRFGCPFAIESEGDPDFADLIFAIAICSRTYEESLAFIQSPWLAFRLKLWGFRVRIQALWRLGDAMADAWKMFCEYRKARMPECWRDDADVAASIGSPFVQTVKIFLLSNCNVSEREIMDMPYSLALWNYATLWEHKGKLQIVTDDDRRAVEEMRAYQRQEAHGTA